MVQHYDLDDIVIQIKILNMAVKNIYNYLIARDYHPGLIDKQFQKFEMMSRHNARKKNAKCKDGRKVKFITTLHLPYQVLKVLLEKAFLSYIEMKLLKKLYQIISFPLFINITKI